MSKNNAVLPVKRPSNGLLPNEREIFFERGYHFLNHNKYWIIGLSLLTIAVVAWFVTSYLKESKLQQKANDTLSAAHSTETLQAVIQNFPGTDAALLATMTLANNYFDQGQIDKTAWDKAASLYQTVAEHYPSSPLRPSALIGLAAVMEAKGNVDEAIKKFRSVASTFPNSFQAPQAQFAAGRLLESAGRLKEAKQSFEELITSHSQSAWQEEAREHLKKINFLLKDSKS